MRYLFPSKEWLKELKNSINRNKEYEICARHWKHGTVTVVLWAYPKFGLRNDIAIILDLDQGKCHNIEIANREKAMKSKFIFEGEYFDWKRVIQRKVEPIKAILDGKLILTKGNLLIIVRFSETIRPLVNICNSINTEFIDDLILETGTYNNFGG